jgi:hypothetical protein
MQTWLIVVLLAMTGGAIACLFGICKAIEKLTQGVFFIRTELTKLNAKLEGAEVAKKAESPKPTGQYESDPFFEAAIDDAFERLKIGITKPQSNKG